MITDAAPSAVPAMEAAPAMLECHRLSKGFGGVPVLKNITLSLQAGTITALAGENGAGKSTLMKIASGQYSPDDGYVVVRGTKLEVSNPRAATMLGVAIVPQELASIPEMTLAENLFLGREITYGCGLINRRAMDQMARARLARFGLDIDPKTRMGSLPVGIRQIIEIVKATSAGAKVLLLDEPSSAISEAEVQRLVTTVLSLRNQGVSVLFTTHKMEEIRQMADRVVVLRDGALVADEPLDQITDDQIVAAMIGRELDALFPDIPAHEEEVILSLSDVVIGRGRAPINLQVRRGEIVGLAGLVGAGRTELLETIFGIRKSLSGRVDLNGCTLRPGRARDAIAHGAALVPEDRKGSGAVMSMSILDNATLVGLGRFSRGGILQGGARVKRITEAMEAVRLKSMGLGQLLETLSGGNQQKVVLGRWLTGNVGLLLLDEPTRGVDVGARSEIYRIIVELASRGLAVLIASSDMPEILSLSHRALVMRGQTVVGSLDRAELGEPAAQDRIFRLASAQLISSTKGS